MKRCCTCRQIKQLSEFNKARSRKDGHQTRCKSCERAYWKTEKGKTVRSKGHKRFNSRHPNYRKAKHAIEKAVHAGQLPRPDTLICQYCPEQAQEYHHYKGYESEYWLDVLPLCIKCHKKQQSIACRCSQFSGRVFVCAGRLFI